MKYLFIIIVTLCLLSTYQVTAEQPHEFSDNLIDWDGEDWVHMDKFEQQWFVGGFIVGVYGAHELLLQFYDSDILYPHILGHISIDEIRSRVTEAYEEGKAPKDIPIGVVIFLTSSDQDRLQGAL